MVTSFDTDTATLGPCRPNRARHRSPGSPATQPTRPPILSLPDGAADFSLQIDASVEPWPTVTVVDAGTAIEEIIILLAEQEVMTRIARERVVTRESQDAVITVATRHAVITGVAKQEATRSTTVVAND
jgi:hypothetical protein